MTTSNYYKISEICEMYHKSKTTVRKYLEEIERDPRYKSAWIYLDDKQPRLVNVLVWEDYLHHKSWLEDKNLRKHLKPYNPWEILWQRGGVKNEG